MQTGGMISKVNTFRVRSPKAVPAPFYFMQYVSGRAFEVGS
jgi:hypothetical protein